MDRIYAINQWGSVLSKNGKPMPLLYIKPDLTLIDMLDKCQNSAWVLISNTESGYDGSIFYAFADKSSRMPNIRQNYFDTTGYWTLALDGTKWMGYPPKTGMVTILDTPCQENINNTDVTTDVDVTTDTDVTTDVDELKVKYNNTTPSYFKDECRNTSTSYQGPSICFKQNTFFAIIALIIILIILAIVVGNKL